MTLLDEVATDSGAALVTITHDPNIAATATRHLRLDGGGLRPVHDPVRDRAHDPALDAVRGTAPATIPDAMLA